MEEITETYSCLDSECKYKFLYNFIYITEGITEIFPFEFFFTSTRTF